MPRRDHYDENGRYIGHSDDPWWADPQLTNPYAGLDDDEIERRVSIQRTNYQAGQAAKAAKSQAAWEAWDRNYTFHLTCAIVGGLVFLCTFLLMLGTGAWTSWFGWLILVISGIAGVAGAVELPEPK